MIPYMWLWWHFAKIANSTPVSLIRFGLITKIRSVHAEDSLVIWVGLVIT